MMLPSCHTYIVVYGRSNKPTMCPSGFINFNIVEERALFSNHNPPGNHPTSNIQANPQLHVGSHIYPFNNTQTFLQKRKHWCEERLDLHAHEDRMRVSLHYFQGLPSSTRSLWEILLCALVCALCPPLSFLVLICFSLPIRDTANRTKVCNLMDRKALLDGTLCNQKYTANPCIMCKSLT